MSEELTPEQIAYQAKEVQQFLRHDSWAFAQAATEQRIKDEWADCTTSVLDREMCWHKLQAFYLLTAELRKLTDPSPGNGRLGLTP